MLNPLRGRHLALACSLVVLLGLGSEDAGATFRARPLCDPNIPDFDEALTADAALRSLKSTVDESWQRLNAHGDPDLRAAGRVGRYNWLCEVKTECGADIGAARACLSEALKKRMKLNEKLLRERGDVH